MNKRLQLERIERLLQLILDELQKGNRPMTWPGITSTTDLNQCLFCKGYHGPNIPCPKMQVTVKW